MLIQPIYIHPISFLMFLILLMIILWNLKLFGKHPKTKRFTGGIQIKNIDFDLGLNINFSDQDTTIVFNPLQLKNMTRESAFFLQNKWDFKEDFKFQFGLRGTHYNLHNKIYFDPRLGAKYTISENFALKGNWGVYHQFLTTANGLDDNLRLVELWLGIQKIKKPVFQIIS